jgi:hypothetical protein
VTGVPSAQAGGCPNASLQGGFSVQAVILHAGTPRAILGRCSFDGKGNFTNTLTLNDNGTVIHASDFGSYIVNADCTGKILTNGGTRTIEIVLVDGGKEFYQPPNGRSFNTVHVQCRQEAITRRVEPV